MMYSVVNIQPWGEEYLYLTGKICTQIAILNPLMPNDSYSGRTAPLTSKRCILYIYSTNTGTEYF